ncbi:GNAT family N-acetyltransferase [Neptuniibacter pectenicola]|uniref:tRNA(Met) cytidine acetyltransferase TmcA n=1 Tax=Neptuniibacter pectenicola TaxID=1806669 RepID=A0ABU9TN72_9GAMM
MAVIESLFTRLQRDAEQHNHRRLLVVSGTKAWCALQAQHLNNLPDLLWIGEPLRGYAAVSDAELSSSQSLPHIKPADLHLILGQTTSSVVFNAWDGFNPNSFGQIAGALAGGSLLVLVCPDLDEWPDYDDPEHKSIVAYPYETVDAGRRFISRVVMLLEDDAYTVIYREKNALAGVEVELPDVMTSSQEGDDEPILPNRTVDQQHAVELILSQFRRGRRPAVLTADRGRGKSVALGIAAAQLSGLDYQQVLITAPDYAAVDEVFAMAHQLLPDYEYSKGLMQHGDHQIRFLAPELALKEPGDGQVLLVDEAAAIPVPVLSKLLQRFPRIGFASTIHGYEGTGQGFSVRFKKVLDRETPNWKRIHLKQPIRWSAHDPLESLTFQLLLLNAQAVEGQVLVEAYRAQGDDTIARFPPVIEKLDRDQLIEDYTTLGQLFGLLILAHYRTSPGDLRVLLDSPNLHIWLLKIDNHVAGAVLVAEEGPLPSALVDDIWSGKRRPRGHLLPQTLVCQEGAKAAAPLKAGRIMRVAIHPALQREQLGTALLGAVQQYAESEGWDYLGASFAASTDLLGYWHSNGFETVRLGTARDSVSGSHAALVLAALSAEANRLQQHLRQRFLEQINYRLSDDLIDLDIPLVCRLLQHGEGSFELTPHDWSDLDAFCHYNRSYESCAYTLHKLLLVFLKKVPESRFQIFLQNDDFLLLVERNMQQKSWALLEQRGQGRKQLMRQFRDVVVRVMAAVKEG